MRTPEEFPYVHPELLVWVAESLDDDDRDEFFHELTMIINAAGSITPETDYRDLLVFISQVNEVIRAWQLSVKLGSDREWNDQIDLALKRQGDLTEDQIYTGPVGDLLDA